MPLYEYYCENCDDVFEALRSVSASDEPAPCPKCGAKRTGSCRRRSPRCRARRAGRSGCPTTTKRRAGERPGEDDRARETEGLREA